MSEPPPVRQIILDVVGGLLYCFIVVIVLALLFTVPFWWGFWQ
jgi:hypothetical protein